ncbi:MAG: hypothetical protein Q4C05_00705 [Akkermansia sp.]|nr:hypothetical protein [Akkermansia sp.]
MSKVRWETSSGDLSNKETALELLREEKIEHVICSIENICLQSFKEDNDLYHVEYVKQIPGGNPEIYAAPEGVNGQELDSLYDKFINGEDFSFVKKEWECQTDIIYKHNHQLMWFIFLAIALVVIALISLQHGWIDCQLFR